MVQQQTVRGFLPAQGWWRGEVPTKLGIGGGVLPAQGWWGSYQLRGRGSVDCSTPGSSVLHYLPLTFMSIESVMPSNHLILCRLFLLWLQSFPTSASSPLSDFHDFSLELNQSFLFLLFCLLLCPSASHMDFQQSPPSKGGRLGTGWRGGGPETWRAMCPGGS